MAIIREHDVDDDGTGLTGTIRDAAWKERLYDQIDAFVTTGEAPGVVTVTNGGTNIVDVVLPAPRPFYYVRVSPTTADITIRSVTTGRTGDLVLIENIGSAYNVFLTHYGSGSATGLFNRVTSGATPLGPRGSALYVFDPSAWSLAQHDQGKAIRVPFNAANYSGDVGSVTVEAVDIGAHDYLLRGNQLTVQVSLTTFSVNGSPTVIRIAGFPFTWQNTGTFPALTYHNGPPYLAGFANSLFGTNRLEVQRADFSAYPASTDGTYIHVNGTYGVT